MMMTPIRVLIVGEQTLFREALQKLLEREPDLLFVGGAPGTWEALELLDEVQPDILLLILNTPQNSGVEILRKLAVARVKPRTILIANSVEKGNMIDALKLGAYGLVPKEAGSRMLFKAIHAVHSGIYWVDQEIVARLVATLNQSPAAKEQQNAYGLTLREMEVLSAIVEGYTNKDIAEKFRISAQTVKHHLSNIFKKVGTSNRMSLAILATNQHWVQDH